MLFRPPLISMTYCSQIFKTVRFLSLPNQPQSMGWSISSQLEVHRYMHIPAGCLLTSSYWLRMNLLVWKPWVSSSAHPAHGHRHCTWFPKHLVDGLLVETTGASKMLLYLTTIQCRIYRIFLITWLADIFFPKLILLEVITRSL